MKNAIEVRDLVKSYKSPLKKEGLVGALQDLVMPEYKMIEAVSGINFQIKQGEFLGYIGPNGAGKSTTIKMLTGILQPSSGTLEVLGLDPFKDRKQYVKKIGVVFGQRTQLWWDIAVKESFELLRRMYEVPLSEYRQRSDMLISAFEVGDLLSVPVRKLSLGQRMKCDIVASLLHNPDILFLDEPTIGLDAIAKVTIREVLRDLHKATGTTILLTTHDLQEIEELCERLMVLDEGKVIFDGTIPEIRNVGSFKRTLFVDLFEEPIASHVATLQSTFGVVSLEIEDAHMKIVFDPTKTGVIELLEKASSGTKVKDIKIEDASIEEIITEVYNKGIFK